MLKGKKISAAIIRAAVLCFIVVFALFLRGAVGEVYIIPMRAMLPNLLVNDHVWVNKLAYGFRWPFSDSYQALWSKPKRGDIVIFRSPYNPHLLSIRRVVGIPGDLVWFVNDSFHLNEKKVIKKHIVNQQVPAVMEQGILPDHPTVDFSHYSVWRETLPGGVSYHLLLKKNQKDHFIYGPYLMPDQYYFVAGDNRSHSQDSRTWPSQIEKAKGYATFFRSQGKNSVPVVIPKGTIVRTGHPHLPEYYETLRPARLEGESEVVPILAKKGGISGNVGEGDIKHIEGALAKKLRVINVSPVTGGVDKNLVFIEDIVGSVSRVIMSCTHTLQFLEFLCHPGTFRWNRFFTFPGPTRENALPARANEGKRP